MYSFRIMGIFSLIPVSILLTVSFFVLFTIRKTENEGIKIFGWMIAVLLWISVALVLSVGIYILLTGHHPMMMQNMMLGPIKHGPMMRGPMLQSPMMPK